jgi:hypothetical protein
MKLIHVLYSFLLLVVMVVLYSCSNKDQIPVATNVDNSASLQKGSHNPVITIFATGFNNPRELKFGPDGFLYVAEGGTGGNISTAGVCDSVIPPIGPYLGGNTGRISKVDWKGVVTTVANNLPSDQTSALSGAFCSSIADVAFIGNDLYALLTGAGCSHGDTSYPNGIIKVNKDGTWNVIADLSTYQKTHPVAHPNADDFEPDGTWYSFINVNGDFYAVEPNHCEMVKVTPTGDINRVIDFSSIYGHIVPTVVAYHKGNFYVSNLDTFPVVSGNSSIYKVSPSGQSTVFATGFSSVLGLVADKDNTFYVLETSDLTGGPAPFTGKVVRVAPSGKRDIVADSLFFPTGMTMGPDGALYVSNKGFGLPPGMGEILRIQVNKEDHDNDDDHHGRGNGDDGGFGHGHGGDNGHGHNEHNGHH